ncbi:DNA alkylation repair protein [Labedella phragmitis]|uniref:DNA alkylation repair protein n=1 Tax=Labedella phragmitis TaxID=2498849 RepID=A0A3S3ZQW5_9MICO|nr:DNA alkylation repair protein [Labedella phragmitis]RWZ51586.1 DNA alkylation repair protein [Labedella phragmitis]
MGAFDEFIGRETVAELRGVLTAVRPDRPWSALGAVHGSLPGHALKARSDLVATALVDDLDGEYVTAAAVFRAALGDPGFRGWTIWPVTESAVTLALADGSVAAFDDALALLSELTHRLTAEFAIRRLLAADLDRSLEAVVSWATSADEHVRRLASEGTRPYLPWAVRVPALLPRSRDLVPVLDRLRDDESEYVRRSVANHLNDVSRHDPDLVVEVARRWSADVDAPRTRAWVVRHALRSLVKKGDPGALEVLGFRPHAVSLSKPAVSAPVVVPGAATFSFDVRNDGDEEARLVVDYVVHYRKANGSTSPKVFKLTTVTLAAGESRSFRAVHAFRPLTTRTHYAGEHSVQSQVNGVRSEATPFDVEL